MRTHTTLLREGGLPVTDLAPVIAGERHPLLFATVSGAHLYGFPSRDSDVDLRGVHVLPAEDLVGLREPEETRSRMWDDDGMEMDLVTHDLPRTDRQLGGGVAGLGVHTCGVVVNHQRSALPQSSALQLHAPSPTPSPTPQLPVGPNSSGSC